MTDYEKLEEIYNIIHELAYTSKEKVFTLNATFITWQVKSEIFIENLFGKESRIYECFHEISKYQRYSGNFNEACYYAQSVIKAYLDNMKEKMEEQHMEINQINLSSNKDLNFSQVFIVHGHDGEKKESVARLIEKQGIHPIILSDEVNSGTTIIEKIEKYDNVGAAICIFSPDDIGKSKKENVERNRARQNVVLETGYFMGKLGRDRVIILSNGDLEFPSDLQGIVYTGADWKIKVLKELNQIGFKVSLSLDKL